MNTIVNITETDENFTFEMDCAKAETILVLARAMALALKERENPVDLLGGVVSCILEQLETNDDIEE